MVSLKNKSKGFTIVELLIVIVVIGILATLVLVTFNGIQQKGRDSKRKTDMGVIEQALDTYYTNNNSYPTLAQVQDSSWVKSHLNGFDPTALQDPKWDGTGSSIVAAPNTLPSSNAGVYYYSVTPSGCDNSATPCTNFVVSSVLEADGSAFSKQSNN